MGKQVEKARDGDPKAAKFLMDYLTGGSPKVQIQQVYVSKRSRSSQRQRVDRADAVRHEAPARGPDPAAALFDARARAARLLGTVGPLPAAKIAAATGLPADGLDEVLGCDWFEATRDGYRLTATGRKEALGG